MRECVLVFECVVGEVRCNCFPVSFLFPCLHCVWALMAYVLPNCSASKNTEQTFIYLLLKRKKARHVGRSQEIFFRNEKCPQIVF